MRARALFAALAAAVVAHLPEIATAAAFLLGWTAVTWGVARLTVPEVWPISAGVLLLSMGGWRLLATIAREGLYALTRGPRNG